MAHSKDLQTQLQGDRRMAQASLPPPGQLAPRLDTAGTTHSNLDYALDGSRIASSNHFTPTPLLTISTPESEINLATQPPSVPHTGSPNMMFGHPFGFSPPYDHQFYHSYSGTSPSNYNGGVESNANEAANFDYTYNNYDPSPSPYAVQHGGSARELAFFDPFEQASSGSSLDLSELYIDNTHMGSLHVDIPIDSSCSERRASEATIKLPLSSENPFDTLSPNFAAESDMWSTVGFSSPSVGSFNSSPSTHGNPSTSGTPFLGFEDTQNHWREPLLSAPQHQGLRSTPESGFTPSAEPPRRERRGAISQQGLPASSSNPDLPMLDDSTAHQLYMDNFHIENPPNRLTPPASYSNGQASDPTHAERVDSPSGPTDSTHEPLAPTCTDVKTEAAQASGASALNRHPSSSKSGGASHHHPYARSVKMAKHEQLIQFDNAPIPGPSKKGSKRSKASKRCHCTYVCPIKDKRCTVSLSRQADMDRHMHTHKTEEDEMIAQGILAPESATEFGVLKPTGGEVCINCKASLSRKDALTRHLRRRDKSECLAAYMKARKWPLNTGTDADDNEE